MESEIRSKYSCLPGLEITFPIENPLKFKTSDGIPLHTYEYPPISSKANSIVIIFHGLHAYSNNHALTAKYLSEINCDVFAFDQRGHGKSGGTRGLIPSFDRVLSDSRKFIEEVSIFRPGLPIFLMGLSMGGCLSIHLSSLLPKMISGLILMCPALCPHTRCEGLLANLLVCLSACCPAMLLMPQHPGEFGDDALQIHYYEENPYLYTGKIRLGTLASIANGMRRGRNLIGSTRTPFVVIHGTADKVVDIKWSELLYLNAPAQDKDFWIYKGLSHTLFFEREIYEISERIQAWVAERVKLNIQ